MLLGLRGDRAESEVAVDEVIVRADVVDATVLQEDETIAATDGRKTMGNDDAGDRAGQGGQRAVTRMFRSRSPRTTHWERNSRRTTTWDR